MKDACVHIYTGDGKGKTTAATGLAARAAGQEMKVAFFQFMKSGLSGEIISLAKLGVDVFSPQGGGKFIWEMDDEEREAYAEIQQDTLARAMGMMDDYDLMVLDELVCAVDAGLVPRKAVEKLLKKRPAGLEVVMTGRGADEDLMEWADYVTEMKMLAHPFEEGKKARRGVEF